MEVRAKLDSGAGEEPTGRRWTRGDCFLPVVQQTQGEKKKQQPKVSSLRSNCELQGSQD